MARRSIISPWALGQPSSTSVRLPTASWGRPFHRAAISPRSSATPTRWGTMCTPSEAMRIRSRRRVVLPAPGGARMRVLSRHPSGPVSLSHTGSAAPRPWRATRTEAEDRFRRLKISPPRRTAVPHSPTRWPPSTVRYPRRIWSSTVWTEARLASSSSCSRSRPVTGSRPRVRSPSGRTAVRGCPHRSRSSSARPRSAGRRLSASCRRRMGSTRAACSYAC